MLQAAIILLTIRLDPFSFKIFKQFLCSAVQTVLESLESLCNKSYKISKKFEYSHVSVLLMSTRIF